MILNHLPISAYSGVLKFDMKVIVNVARLEIGQRFTQGEAGTLDTFLVVFTFLQNMRQNMVVIPQKFVVTRNRVGGLSGCTTLVLRISLLQKRLFY